MCILIHTQWHYVIIVVVVVVMIARVGVMEVVVLAVVVVVVAVVVDSPSMRENKRLFPLGVLGFGRRTHP